MPRLLSFAQLHDLFGGGRGKRPFRLFLWRAARRGELVPVRIGPYTVAWREDEVNAWMASRPRAAGLKPASVAQEAK